MQNNTRCNIAASFHNAEKPQPNRYKKQNTPTDLKALFLLKVLSNDDALYPLVVF
jgi:hypothetical protein